MEILAFTLNKIFEKYLRMLKINLIRILLVPFSIQAYKKFEPHWVFEDPKKFVDRLDFALTASKCRISDLVQLELLTNLDAKGIQRSVIKWASSFQKCFIKMFCFTWKPGRQKFLHYMRMKYFGCFVFNGSLPVMYSTVHLASCELPTFMVSRLPFFTLKEKCQNAKVIDRYRFNL